MEDPKASLLQRRNRERHKIAQNEDSLLLLQQRLEAEFEELNLLGEDQYIQLTQTHDGAIVARIMPIPTDPETEDEDLSTIVIQATIRTHDNQGGASNKKTFSSSLKPLNGEGNITITMSYGQDAAGDYITIIWECDIYFGLPWEIEITSRKKHNIREILGVQRTGTITLRDLPFDPTAIDWDASLRLISE